jgi:hypothetical protein
VQPHANRLSDQDWEKYFLEGGPVPERPDWVASYLLNSNGAAYPEGRALKGEHYTGTGIVQPDDRTVFDYMLVYPNPASSSATLSFVLMEKGDLQLEVFDASGRMIHRDIHPGLPAAEHYLPLPVAHWPGGLYLVKAGVGRHSVVRELMIR